MSTPQDDVPTFGADDSRRRDASSFGAGHVLDGRFRIERELGGGGMSTVFVARDLRHDRDVVVKLVSPELTAAVGGERFLGEIEMIARMAHPNILPLHDSGATGGRLWYVAPYMEGGSLRGRMEATPQMPLLDVVRITQSVAEALEYAHGRGIVHRDIKPENILFSGEVPVMADFGIARALTRAGGARLTQAGMVVGTPRYMSPEQAADEATDARSDVYSLAAVVYEMLVGEPPYPGDNPVRVMASHVRDPVPTLRDKRPAVSAAVESVVRRGLQKRPGDRYPTARAFADALAGAVTGATDAVPAVTPTRNRWRTAAMVGLTIAATYGVTRWVGSEPDGPPRLIVLPFEYLGPPEDRFIAEGLADEVTSRVAGLSGLAVVARNTALRFDPRSGDLPSIARDANAAYLVTATVRTDRSASGTRLVRVTPHLIRTRGERELWSKTYDASFVPGELFRVQTNIAEQVAASLGVQVLQPERGALEARPTQSVEAYAAYLRGLSLMARRYEERSGREAAEAFREATTADSGFALAWARLGEALVIRNYYFADKRPDWLDEARDAIARAERVAPTDPDVRLARAYLSWWGERNATKASDDLARLLTQRPNDVEAMILLAQVRRRGGRYDSAESLLRRAAKDDPQSFLIAMDLGSVLTTVRRYPEADAELVRALRLAPDYAPAAVTRALLTWGASGSPDSGRRRLEASMPPVKVREAVKWSYRYPLFVSSIGGVLADSALTVPDTADGFDAAKLLLAKGFVLRSRGDSARARAAFGDARRAFERRLQAAPQDAEMRALLGLAFAGLGQREAAAREGDAALALAPSAEDEVRAITVISNRLAIAVTAGDVDTGLRQMTALLSRPTQFSEAMFRRDPLFAALRASPRFEAALAAARTSPSPSR